MLEPMCLICETRKAKWVIDVGDGAEFLCGLHLVKRMDYLRTIFDVYVFEVRTLENYNLLLCLDCKRNVRVLREMFMVFDDVWLQACENRRGMLCVKCFETRLGRKLAPGDFTHCRMNAGQEGKSRLLRNRLGLLIEHGLLE